MATAHIVRRSDWDPIRGIHHGPRSCAPHLSRPNTWPHLTKLLIFHFFLAPGRSSTHGQEPTMRETGVGINPLCGLRQTLW